MRSFERLSAAALGVLAVVCAAAGSAAASVPNIPVVPEIDLSVIPAAAGIVTAGVLMLRARRGSK